MGGDASAGVAIAAAPKLDVLATGLGHPEGPDVLPDGRVVFVNSFKSEVAVWDPASGMGTYAHTGGGPAACAVGADGYVYITQGPKIGPWVAPEPQPPSIQRIAPDGGVELVCAEVAGIALDGPNDLAFGADGRLWFTDPGAWDEQLRPDPGRIFAIDAAGRGELIAELDYVYPNGIAADPDGSMVWAESYDRTLRRGTPDGRRELICAFPEGHVPDGLKRDVAGNYWVAGERSGTIAVVRPDGTIAQNIPVGTYALNCVFSGTTLYVTDSGPTFDTFPTWDGQLVRFDAGVAGMPLFRGSAEHGFAPGSAR
jgi:gluconolactonase